MGGEQSSCCGTRTTRYTSNMGKSQKGDTVRLTNIEELKCFEHVGKHPAGEGGRYYCVERSISDKTCSCVVWETYDTRQGIHKRYAKKVVNPSHVFVTFVLCADSEAKRSVVSTTVEERSTG